MAYIGRDVSYGVLDTQSFPTNGNDTEFALEYAVGSETSLLLVSDGTVLKPVTDYRIINGGTTLQLQGGAPSSSVSLFGIFMALAVTLATVQDNSITPQKMTNGLRRGMMHDEVYSTTTTAFTANTQTHYYTAQVGPITITLPPNPSFGEKVMITQVSSGAVTVARNGSVINGTNSNRQIGAQYQTVSFTFVDSTHGWVANGQIT